MQTQHSPEQIARIISLGLPFYPRKILDEAASRREEMLPFFLETLKKAADNPLAFLESGDDALPFATIYCSLWKVTEAFPLLAPFLNIQDEDLLDELWGDIWLEDFSTFLYQTAGENKRRLSELLHIHPLNVYSHGQILEAWVFSLVDETVDARHRPTRTELEAVLKNESERYRTPNEINLHKNANIVSSYLDLYEAAKDKAPLPKWVEDLFREGLVDEQIIDLEYLEERIAEGPNTGSISWAQSFQKRTDRKSVHEYTHWWPVVKIETQWNKLNSLTNELKSFLLPLESDFHADLAVPLISGLVCGLKTVGPTVCIDLMLRSNESKSFSFHDQSHAMQFLKIIQELWNTIVELNELQAHPWGLAYVVPITEEHEHTFMQLNSHFLASFFIGLKETYSLTTESPEAQESLHWFEKMLLTSQKKSTNATKWVNEFQDEFEDHYFILLDALREERVVNLQPIHSEKIGRNEGCPCGSGKKFKKCCLH